MVISSTHVSCVNGTVEQRSTLGAKTLDTKDISSTWEQEYFVQSLVDPKKILLPSHHIKLGI
jgi:6-phosphogluconate dehydrogenase